MMNRQQFNLLSYKKNLVLLPVLGLTLLAGGCSFNFSLGDKTLEANDAQTKIKDELIKQTGLTVNSVTCPSEIKAKVGETFECKADTNAGNIPILAKTTDDKGGFKWNAQDFLNLKLAEDSIQTGIKQQLKTDVIANCGEPKYKVAKAGDKFNCEIEDQQKNKREVQVTVKDSEGTISWKLI
jgi:hypothetical protein